MATGARSEGNTGAAAPEKLQRLAEERFLAGDITGALRVAREAKACCGRPLPSSLAHALAAYEVHAAACGSGGRNWYAVLGLACGVSVTHEDVKRRYRQLCLVLHPDKNRSAAAEGAFKLLQNAWAALAARHPPAPPSAEQKPSNYSRPPPAAAAPTGAEKRRADPPPASDTSYSYGRKPRQGTPPPPPPRTFRTVHCGQCDRKYNAPDIEFCVLCHGRLRKPRQPGAAGAETPRRGGYRSFSCPVPGCGGHCMPWMLDVDMWKLRCMSCRHEPEGPPISRDDLVYDLYEKMGSTR